MESSAFWAAGYAEDKSWLYLLLRSGEVYRYFDVPRGGFQRAILRARHSGALPLRASAPFALSIPLHFSFLVTEKT